ncbi:hypothetical protein TNCV_2859201 [Trichonephila clavipes]|nr:hypothetical protein TNCV_2859201 [Trichonephila clavipes]
MQEKNERMDGRQNRWNSSFDRCEKIPSGKSIRHWVLKNKERREFIVSFEEENNPSGDSVQLWEPKFKEE